MGGIDLDVIKGIPGYKVIMKAVLKHQIQQLVEQLSETTGEESILLTASVTDGSLSHLGSESGKSFLEGHEEIKSQFLGHVLKIHHSKKTEKQFAAGPGRKSDAQQSLMYEGEDESAYSETHFSTEAQQSIQQPSVSVNRPMERGKQKPQNKVPRSSEIKTRPRRSAAATRSPFKSDLYVANEEDIEDFDMEQDELETTSRITSLDKAPVKYTETMPVSGPTVLDPKQDTENSFKTEGYDGSGVFSEGMGTLEEHGGDSIVIVKKEVESDHEAGTITDEEDPDWEPGKKKQRKSSGSMSVTSAVAGQTQNDDIQTKCGDCGKTYKSAANLKRHQQVHREPQLCHCGAKFPTKEALQEHNNAKHKSLYVCKDCPAWKQFASRSGLFAHKIRAHKSGKTLKCEVCDRRFGQLGHLKDHMTTHSSEAKWVCSTCGTKFKFEYSLKKHVKVCTGQAVKRGRPRTSETPITPTVSCDDCGKSFRGQRYLKQHQQKHISDMRICPSCGKSLKFRSSMSRHIKTCTKKDYEDSVNKNDSDDSENHSGGYETIHVIAADGQDISTTNHLVSQTDHVTTAANQMTAMSDHVTETTNREVDTTGLRAFSSGTILSGLTETVYVLTDTTGCVVDTGVVSAVENVLRGAAESVTVLTSPAVVTSDRQNETIDQNMVISEEDAVEYTAILSEPPETEQDT